MSLVRNRLIDKEQNLEAIHDSFRPRVYRSFPQHEPLYSIKWHPQDLGPLFHDIVPIVNSSWSDSKFDFALHKCDGPESRVSTKISKTDNFSPSSLTAPKLVFRNENKCLLLSNTVKYLHMKRLLIACIGLLTALSFSSCGYNTMVAQDENVKGKWAQVENAYQRRADLVPNLVNTVKGAAQHEEGTLTAVTEARAKATSVQVDPSNLTDESIANYQQVQDGLSQSIGRL